MALLPVDPQAMDYTARIQRMTMPQMAPVQRPGFIQGISGMLFPTTPGMDPAASQAAQRQALMMMGLGMMSGANRPGATIGSSLFEGYQGAAQNYAGAMDTAFRNTLLKQQTEREERREEREKKALEREERTRSGDVARRVSTGMSSASDPMAYWNLMRSNPEVQGTLQQFGLQEPQTPEQAAALAQQLGAVGAVSGPAVTPRDVELKAVVDPATGRQKLVQEAEAIGQEPGYAPVAPTGQLTSMDLPGGMKQNVIFDPRARTTTPVGQPFKEGSQVKPTGENQAAAGYLGRMTNAEQQLGQYSPSLQDYAAFGTVLSGNAITSAAANRVMTPEGQAYYQATADWVRAKLRKESGAVIGKEEMMAEIRTYFPVPGDSQKVVAQKARARQQAMEAMSQAAGPAVQGPEFSPSMPAETFAPNSPESIEAEMRRRGLLK